MLDSDNIVLTADATDAAYCYGSCSACVPLVVTFTTDMSVVSSVALEGVFVARSKVGTQDALMDNGDGT